MLDSDVAIIGAGPIGLELAVAFKQVGVDYVQFEAGRVAQTISWFPRMTTFFSSADRIAIAGVPLLAGGRDKATREEYLDYLCGIVTRFDLDVRTYEKVTRIDKVDGGFEVATSRGGVVGLYGVGKVVLAVGDMARPRLLHIGGEDLEHVRHYFDDPERYHGKKVLIVGGKNSAVEAAIRCHRAGAQVTLSYRGKDFDAKRVKKWLLPKLESLVTTGRIRFLPETVPQSITAGRVTLVPSPGLIGDAVRVEAECVLLLTGYVMDTTLFDLAGVTLGGQNQAPTVDERSMQSNVAGIYVAGTAVAGTQEVFRLFIENCHVHVKRIVEAVTGEPFEADWARNRDGGYSSSES